VVRRTLYIHFKTKKLKLQYLTHYQYFPMYFYTSPMIVLS